MAVGSFLDEIMQNHDELWKPEKTKVLHQTKLSIFKA